jgi:hypothetical protein
MILFGLFILFAILSFIIDAVVYSSGKAIRNITGFQPNMMDTQMRETYFGASYDPRATSTADGITNVVDLPPEMMAELGSAAVANVHTSEMVNLPRVLYNPGDVNALQPEIENVTVNASKYIIKPKTRKERGRGKGCFNNFVVSFLLNFSLTTLS